MKRFFMWLLNNLPFREFDTLHVRQIVAPVPELAPLPVYRKCRKCQVQNAYDATACTECGSADLLPWVNAPILLRDPRVKSRRPRKRKAKPDNLIEMIAKGKK